MFDDLKIVKLIHSHNDTTTIAKLLESSNKRKKKSKNDVHLKLSFG